MKYEQTTHFNCTYVFIYPQSATLIKISWTFFFALTVLPQLKYQTNVVFSPTISLFHPLRCASVDARTLRGAELHFTRFCMRCTLAA